MSWYVYATTVKYEEFKEYSSYDEPTRALEDGLRKMSQDLVGKEIRKITLEKS